MAVLGALEQAHGFTKTEQDIAAFVLAHPDDVCAMSIGELSDAAFVSSASIVRLCHKMGVEGYREFRIALAADLERARSSNQDINPDTPFLEGQGTRDIMSSIANLKKQAVERSYATMPPHAVQKVAGLILGAKRVALFAIGDSEISCEGFANLLVKIGIICYAANQHGDSLAVSSGLGPQDLAIVVTYSGQLLGQLRRQLSLLRDRRCKLVVISSDQDIPNRLAGLDCFVALPSGESTEGKIATFFAQESVRYALECIYGECFARNYLASMKQVERIDASRRPSNRKNA